MKRRIIAIIGILSLLIGSAACGETAEEKAAEEQRMEQLKQEALEGLGATPLPAGLTGSCEGDDPRLHSVSLSTTDGRLTVSIPDNDQLAGAEFYGYFIMFTNASDHSTQVGFKNIVTAQETHSFIYNMGNSKQTNYGPWTTDATADGDFEMSIDSDQILGNRGTEWVATLSVDGVDVATCPADGSKAVLE